MLTAVVIAGVLFVRTYARSGCTAYTQVSLCCQMSNVIILYIYLRYTKEPKPEEPKVSEHKPEQLKKDDDKTITAPVHYPQPTEHKSPELPKSTYVAPVPLPKPEETHAPVPVYPPTEHKTNYPVHEPTYVPSAPVYQPGTTVTPVTRPSGNATTTHTPVMYTGGAPTTGALTGVGAMIAGFAAFLL